MVGSGIVTQCLSLARSVSLVFSASRWGILWIILVGNIVDTFDGDYCGYFWWGILWILLKSCRYLYQVLKLDISLMEMSVMVRISNV